MPIVSLRRVPEYDDEALYQAVCAHFEALGVETELKPDTHVLLKPNLLAGRDPSLGVTTHPAVLRALIRRLRELGVKRIVVADSPGGVYTATALKKIYDACGYAPLAPLAELNENTESAEARGFTLIRPVLDADFIINCPRLKTHGLTVMTAGVKNLFGCLPGLLKPEHHYHYPNIEDFANRLIDLALAVNPNLTFLDAIDCMEGNGPGGGKIRTLGCTLASRDVFALDEAAAMLMAIQPVIPPTVRYARKRNLSDPATLELLGDPLTPANPPFLLPDAFTKGERFFSVNGLFHCFFGRKRTFPAIRTEECIGCGRCAESCPKHIISIVNHKAVIARKGCISCFCCQEMCPAHAVGTQRKRAW